jgi:hypothetical protein
MPSLALPCRRGFRRALAGARRTLAALGDPFLPDRVMQALRGAGGRVGPPVDAARLAAIADALARRDAADASAPRPARGPAPADCAALPAAGARR